MRWGVKLGMTQEPQLWSSYGGRLMAIQKKDDDDVADEGGGGGEGEQLRFEWQEWRWREVEMDIQAVDHRPWQWI